MLKKLSLAAALSIGLMTVSGIANAACPVCPQQSMIPQEPCPIQQTICPSCQQTPCACPVQCNPCASSISACCPNYNPDAQILKRQVYAYPSIGGSSVVMPKGVGLLQIGGGEEAIATGNCVPSSLTAAPEFGRALTLYPKEMTGGACGINPVCPKQVMQGTDILRCNMPNSTGILQSAYWGENMMGAAAPISSCDPCQSLIPCCPTGAAAPCDPCAPCGAEAQLQGCPIPIQTSSGIQVQKTTFVPCETPVCPSGTVPICPTGAACPVNEQFPDVSNNMFAGCDINKLASAGVLVGYPDRTYKPNLPILRSEFASAMVAGLQLENVPAFDQQIFKDVSTRHWANSDIDKAYNRGIMAGYPDDSFKPNKSVSRAEALASMAKVIPGCMSTADAENTLKAYPDANELPGWASIPVAESLNAGLTKDLPDNTHIRPNEEASRADIASMLNELRIKLCIDPCPQPVACAPCAPTGGAAYQPQVVTSTIPTLKVKMEDLISARTGEVGDIFKAKTTEAVTIGGVCYPSGSSVSGRVVEIIRPAMGDHGGVRLAFDKIKNGASQVTLPSDVISATVVKENNPNIIGRTLAWPFSWTGKVVGITGRTVGGTVILAGNALEGFGTNFGNGTNELFNAKLGAAGRSYLIAGKDILMAPVDVARTAFSGTAGILKESADEIAYVVSPDGSRIAQVNPYEVVSIAFGCK